MKNKYSPLDNNYTSFSAAARSLHVYIANQVPNAFVIQNPHSTKLNTLCRCQTRLHNHLKPSIHLISYEITMVQMLIQYG